jgi:hypothetical protein
MTFMGGRHVHTPGNVSEKKTDFLRFRPYAKQLERDNKIPSSLLPTSRREIKRRDFFILS